MDTEASLTAILFLATLVTGQQPENIAEPSQTPFLPHCCAQINNADHFFITSPELHNASDGFNCFYQITQNSSSVSYLNLKLHYFSVGSSSQHQPYYCDNDFLEISGVRLCGCWNDIVMKVDFTQQNITLKLNMKSASSKGFVIEVKHEAYVSPWGSFKSANGDFYGFPAIDETAKFKLQYSQRLINDSSSCLDEPISKTKLVNHLNLTECQPPPTLPTPMPTSHVEKCTCECIIGPERNNSAAGLNSADSHNPFTLAIPFIILIIYHCLFS